MSFFQYGNHCPKYTDAVLTALIKRGRARNLTAICNCGPKVLTLSRLAELSQQKKSVYCLGCFGLKPAAVIMSLQARIVHQLLTDGRVHEYQPIAKSRHKKLDAVRARLLGTLNSHAR